MLLFSPLWAMAEFEDPHSGQGPDSERSAGVRIGNCMGAGPGQLTTSGSL